MSALINSIFRHIKEFLSSAVKRRLLIIGILVIVALTEFLVLGLARRTFVFYTMNEGVLVVEDRMLKHAKSREGDVIRYVEETLLGPVSPDLLPLFQRGTRLKSLLLRNGVVFIDFTENAALPPIEGGNTIVNYQTFYDSILRNFSYVKDVRFFIEGNVVFIGEFSQEAIENQEDFSDT